MQLSFFLLAAAAILLTGSDVVSASTSKDVSPHSTNFVGSAGPVSVHARFLRTSQLADTDSDDQNIESDDEERGLSGPVTEKAAATAAKLTRSKTLESEKAAVQKLARSKSLSDLDAYADLEKVAAVLKKDVKRNTPQDFKIMDKQNKDPDMMFNFFGLNPKVSQVTKADKHLLRQVAGKSDERFAHYVLWYKYSKYYKKAHPGWKSEITPPVVHP